jgi:DNA polymerase III sliding clamp (beta) subunit (PCNA family)
MAFTYECPPNIQKMLMLVSSLPPLRSPIPAFSFVRIRAETGEFMVFESTSGAAETRCRVLADHDGSGEIAVPAGVLNDLLSSLPRDTSVVLSQRDTRLRIEWPDGECEIGGISTNTLPPLSPAEKKNAWSVDRAGEWQQAINDVLFVASANLGNLRMLLMQRRGDNLEMIATDGFRMAIKMQKVYINDPAIDGIAIPYNAALEWAKICGRLSDLPARIAVSRRVTLFVGDGNQVEVASSAEPSHSNIPSYEPMIPSKPQAIIEIPSDTLANACRAARAITQQSVVTLSIEHGGVNIKSRGGEGEYEDLLPASVQGKGMEVRFDAGLLAEGLEKIGGKAIIWLRDSTSPCLIQSEGEDFRYLLMPMVARGG